MTPPKPQPDRQVAPTVARVRLKYAKRRRMRFSSHRDFQRALERAIRRVGVPIAYSAGFTPHPKISYINAAPTGTASEAEYLEIGLTRQVDVDVLRRELDATMPDGFSILEAVAVNSPDFAERMQGSFWEVLLPGVSPEQAAQACEQLLAAEQVEVERLTKSGIRRFDARAALLHIAVVTHSSAPDSTHGAEASGPEEGSPCAILQAVLRHDTPAVRPDDVLAALRHVSGLESPVPPLVTRLAQGPLVADARSLEHSIGDPLAPDRA